jgi:hypothetical protein
MLHDSPRTGWLGLACILLVLAGLTYLGIHSTPPESTPQAKQEPRSDESAAKASDIESGFELPFLGKIEAKVVDQEVVFASGKSGNVMHSRRYPNKSTWKKRTILQSTESGWVWGVARLANHVC